MVAEKHRSKGINWDAIADLWWPPAAASLVPDGPLARVLGVTTPAVRAARSRRGTRGWSPKPAPTDMQIRIALQDAGIISSVPI